MSRFVDILNGGFGSEPWRYFYLVGYLSMAEEAMWQESRRYGAFASAVVDTGADDARGHGSALLNRDGDIAGVAQHAVEVWLEMLKGSLSAMEPDGSSADELSRQEFEQLIRDIEMVGQVLRKSREDSIVFCGQSPRSANRIKTRYDWLITETDDAVAFLQSLDLRWTWAADGNPLD